MELFPLHVSLYLLALVLMCIFAPTLFVIYITVSVLPSSYKCVLTKPSSIDLFIYPLFLELWRAHQLCPAISGSVYMMKLILETMIAFYKSRQQMALLSWLSGRCVIYRPEAVFRVIYVKLSSPCVYINFFVQGKRKSTALPSLLATDLRQILLCLHNLCVAQKITERFIKTA